MVQWWNYSRYWSWDHLTPPVVLIILRNHWSLNVVDILSCPINLLLNVWHGFPRKKAGSVDQSKVFSTCWVLGHFLAKFYDKMFGRKSLTWTISSQISFRKTVRWFRNQCFLLRKINFEIFNPMAGLY